MSLRPCRTRSKIKSLYPLHVCRTWQVRMHARHNILPASAVEQKTSSNESVSKQLTLAILHGSASERDLDVKACKACSGVGKIYESMNIKDPSTDDLAKMPVSLALPRCHPPPHTSPLSSCIAVCIAISIVAYPKHVRRPSRHHASANRQQHKYQSYLSR